MYKSYFERNVNPTNLALFIDNYIRRTDLNIQRDAESGKTKESLTLTMPVLNITGALSPHIDDTVTLNGRLDPRNSSWMKVSDIEIFSHWFEIPVSTSFEELKYEIWSNIQIIGTLNFIYNACN